MIFAKMWEGSISMENTVKSSTFCHSLRLRWVEWITSYISCCYTTEKAPASVCPFCVPIIYFLVHIMENVVNILLTLDITYNNTQATLGFGKQKKGKEKGVFKEEKKSRRVN